MLCSLRFVIEFLCNTNGCLSVSSSEPASVISMFKEIFIKNLYLRLDCLEYEEKPEPKMFMLLPLLKIQQNYLASKNVTQITKLTYER